MNMNYVSIECAKKLKEKGFQEQCLCFYNLDNDLEYNIENPISDRMYACWNSGYFGVDYYVDAPVESQVLRWFRKKGYEVVASFNYYTKKWFYQVGNMSLEDDSIISYKENFDDYETALEAGIMDALNYV